MPDEGSFLRAILANPADDLPRLVYADWLDEQQTTEARLKAEFIRLQHALKGYTRGDRSQLRNRDRFRELAALFPVGWLMTVAHTGVENCEAGRTLMNYRHRLPLDTVEYAYECPKTWAAMTLTESEKVRYCQACQRNVYYCETVEEAWHWAWQGECVAVSVTVRRRENRASEPQIALGRVVPSYWDRLDQEMGEGLL